MATCFDVNVYKCLCMCLFQEQSKAERLQERRADVSGQGECDDGTD